MTYLQRVNLCSSWGSRCVTSAQLSFNADSQTLLGLIQRNSQSTLSTSRQQRSRTLTNAAASPATASVFSSAASESSNMTMVSDSHQQTGSSFVPPNLHHQYHSSISSPSLLSNKQMLLVSGLEERTTVIPSLLQLSDVKSTGGKTSQSEDKSNSNLDKIAFDLTYDLTNIFLKSSDWSLYSQNIVFEDRIRGKRVEGLAEYMKNIYVFRTLAHLKFVYVRFHVINLSIHPEDNTIRIRWRVAGLGVMRMVVRFIPDKMWRRGSMDDAAPTWYDGYSIFHVGPDNKIVRHVADRRKQDEDKQSLAMHPVVEKLKKLKPNTPSPAL